MDETAGISGSYPLNRTKVMLHTVLDVYVYALVLIPLAAVFIYFNHLEIFYMAIVVAGILALMLPYSLIKGAVMMAKTPKVVELRGSTLHIDDWMVPLDEISTVKMPPETYRKAAKIAVSPKQGRTRTFYLGYLKKNGNPVFPEYIEFAGKLEDSLKDRPGCFQLDL